MLSLHTCSIICRVSGQKLLIKIIKVAGRWQKRAKNGLIVNTSKLKSKRAPQILATSLHFNFNPKSTEPLMC